MASERSNAVGTVELECAPAGLSLLYLQASSFTQGYVPAHQSQGEKLFVPWDQLGEASADGEQVFMAFDAKLTPLNRLCLVNFSTGNTAHHHKLYRRRFLVRLTTVGAASSGALIASAAAFRLAPGTSAASALGIAVTTAIALCALGFFADQLLKSGGIEGSMAREAFLAELSGFVPSLLRSKGAPPSVAPKAPTIAVFQGFLPRTTAAIVISLTALTLAFVLMVRWLLTSDPAHELASHLPRATDTMPVGTGERGRSGPTPSVAQALPRPTPHDPPPAPAPAPEAAVCRCGRSDSLLWQDAIPALSVVTLSQHVRRGREEDERKDKNYLELGIGIINNSNQTLKDVALLVEAFERDPPPSSKRYSTATRPLFFEGPLAPGQAVKWDVEARGSEFEVHHELNGNVGRDGENAAPTNLLAELLHARNRPVRMHGAMLLTYFGDPRAKDAILELREALREDEAPYLDRLLQAASDVKVCSLEVTGSGDVRSARACVFNASKEVKKDLALRIRGLDSALLDENPSGAPPNVLAEATLSMAPDLAASSGRVVGGEISVGGTSPVAFEAFADRSDLLPR